MDKAAFLEFLGQFGLYRHIDGLGDRTIPRGVVASAYDAWETSRSLEPVAIYERVVRFLNDAPGRGIYENAFLDWMQDILDGRGYWQVDEIFSPWEIPWEVPRLANLIAEHRCHNAAREAIRLRREQAARALSDPELRRQVFERDGHQCRACSSRELLAVDHIVAVINGGSDDIDNLQTLCRTCNSSKGRKELKAWQRRHGSGRP